MLDSEIVFIFIFIFLTDNKAKFQNQIKFFMKCKCWGLVCLRGFVFFSPYICEREVFSNIVMNDLIISKLKWKYFLIYTKIQIFQRLRGEQRMVWILFPHCMRCQMQKPQLVADRAIPHEWGGKREDQVHLAEGGQTESRYAPGQPLVLGASRPRPHSLAGTGSGGLGTWQGRNTRRGGSHLVRSRGPSPWSIPWQLACPTCSLTDKHLAVSFYVKSSCPHSLKYLL